MSVVRFYFGPLFIESYVFFISTDVLTERGLAPGKATQLEKILSVTLIHRDDTIKSLSYPLLLLSY